MEEQSGSTQPKLSKTPTGSTADLTGGKSGSGKTIGNYEVVKNIGEGSFAKVRLAVHRLTGQKVSSSTPSFLMLTTQIQGCHQMHRQSESSG